MVVSFINIGKKDHVQPVHIIEMLNRNVAGRVDVGRIDLMQSFSFFECPEEYTEEILSGMDGVNYKGRQVHVEVAETRSEGGQEAVEKPARERKPERKSERKPERKSDRKSDRKPERKPERAPEKKSKKVQDDDDFWNNFENEDWHQFFRSGNGKPSKKHKEKKPAHKEKVNGRKAARTAAKPKRSRR